MAKRIIDTNEPDFADLKANYPAGWALMSDLDKNAWLLTAIALESLNGEIILERDLYPDGRLRGVISIHPDVLLGPHPSGKTNLEAILEDTDDAMGHQKYLEIYADLVNNEPVFQAKMAAKGLSQATISTALSAKVTAISAAKRLA